jgi:hypothetical protein
VETAITISAANMNSVVAGDWFRLQVQRITTGDTTGQALQLYGVSIEEVV